MLKMICSITIACFIGAGSQLLAADLEAKKNGVNVYSEANKKSDVIKKLNKGESLESVERKGMYWQVKLEDGKTGFVSVMKVKRQQAKKSGLNGLLNAAVKEGRAEREVNSTRSRSTVMGVRGLDDTSETAFAGNMKPNLNLVYAMEDYAISDQRLERHGDAVFAEIESLAD